MLTKKQMQSLPAGRHLIEPNLYLRVRSATSKYFTFKYALNGSRKELTLGKFEGVSGFLCLGRLFQGQPNEAALCI